MRRFFAALLCLLVSLNVATAAWADIGNALEHAAEQAIAMDGWPEAAESEHHHHAQLAARTVADQHAHEAVEGAAHGEHVHLSQCPGSLPAAELRLPVALGRDSAPSDRVEKWASALPHPLERPPRPRPA